MVPVVDARNHLCMHSHLSPHLVKLTPVFLWCLLLQAAALASQAAAAAEVSAAKAANAAGAATVKAAAGATEAGATAAGAGTEEAAAGNGAEEAAASGAGEAAVGIGARVAAGAEADAMDTDMPGPSDVTAGAAVAVLWAAQGGLTPSVAAAPSAAPQPCSSSAGFVAEQGQSVGGIGRVPGVTGAEPVGTSGVNVALDTGAEAAGTRAVDSLSAGAGASAADPALGAAARASGAVAALGTGAWASAVPLRLQGLAELGFNCCLVAAPRYEATALLDQVCVKWRFGGG